MAETTAERLARLEGVINTHIAKVDATFEKLAAAIDFVARQDLERLTATREMLQSNVTALATRLDAANADVRSDIAVVMKRLDANEERIRANFRMVVTALAAPLLVAIVAGVLLYALVGHP